MKRVMVGLLDAIGSGGMRRAIGSSRHRAAERSASRAKKRARPSLFDAVKIEIAFFS
jgi:hypothetical protein